MRTVAASLTTAAVAFSGTGVEQVEAREAQHRKTEDIAIANHVPARVDDLKSELGTRPDFRERAKDRSSTATISATGDTITSMSQNNRVHKEDTGRMSRLLKRGHRVGFSRSMRSAARYLQGVNDACDLETGGSLQACLCSPSSDFDCDCSNFSNGNGDIQCGADDGCYTYYISASEGSVDSLSAQLCYKSRVSNAFMCVSYICHQYPCTEPGTYEYICPAVSFGSCTCRDVSCGDGSNTIFFDCGPNLYGTFCDEEGFPETLQRVDTCIDDYLPEPDPEFTRVVHKREVPPSSGESHVQSPSWKVAAASMAAVASFVA